MYDQLEKDLVIFTRVVKGDKSLKVKDFAPALSRLLNQAFESFKFGIIFS